MKCKDCFWFSDITVNCCERDGSEPCDPEANACREYEDIEEITIERALFLLQNRGER